MRYCPGENSIYWIHWVVCHVFVAKFAVISEAIFHAPCIKKPLQHEKKCKLLLGKKNFVDIKPQQTSLIDSYVVRRRIKSFMKKTIVKMMRILVQNIDITLQVNNEQDAKIFMVFFMCKFCIAKVKCKYLIKFMRMHFVRKLSTKTQCRLNNCVEILCRFCRHSPTRFLEIVLWAFSSQK